MKHIRPVPRKEGAFVDTGFEKRKRLTCVAQRYCLEDQRQRDTARKPDASRPLISRMLSEARKPGIMEVTAHEPAGADGD